VGGITNEPKQQTQRHIWNDDTSWDIPKIENLMDYEHRTKIPMTTWKRKEQKERKDPSHIYDRRGKVDDNKRRRTYICLKTEKKERERWTYDNEVKYVTETITNHWKSLEMVEIKKSVCSPLVKLYKKSFLYERRPLLT